MKSYPSISTDVDFSLPYYVFDKLDGSNVRAQWSPKKGFYKFGSRHQLLDESHDLLGACVPRMKCLSAPMHEVLLSLKSERVVCFFEWVGPQSFAGRHWDDDSDMELVLLDVDVYKKGRLSPKDVLKLAQQCEVPTPTLLHTGKVSKQFLEDVRTGNMPGITSEGVIGKGPVQTKCGGPAMFKWKTQSWFDRLKTFCNDDQKLFEQLK